MPCDRFFRGAGIPQNPGVGDVRPHSADFYKRDDRDQARQVGAFQTDCAAIIQMLIFGYAATFEVYHVSTVILDLDHSQESRELTSDFTASGRFSIISYARNQRDVTNALDSGSAAIAIAIQPGFAELLHKGATAPLAVSVDGTNSNTALIALGYVGQVAATFSQRYATDFLRRTSAGQSLHQASVTLEERPWYNEDTNSRWFFVPGVIGTLTLTLIVNLTAFAIVREREVGTLEQIMVTPIRPIEFILGKTLPFFVIGLGEVALVMAVGLLWFQVPSTAIRLSCFWARPSS